MCVMRSSFVCFFFFSLLCRPPRSPLFPYTTLFRSLLAQEPADDGGGERRRRGLAALVLRQHHVRGHDELHASLEDRKSTRLNSSHLGISYAVFCLKKKKKTESSWRIQRLIDCPSEK